MLLHQRKRKGGILIEGLLILVGAGLIIKAFSIGLGTYQFVHSRDNLPISGTILEINDHGFTATIEYVLTSGEKRVFQQRGFFLRSDVGEAVPVLYDPGKAGFSVVDKYDASWFTSMLYAFPGLIFLIIGLRKWAVRSL